MADYYPLLARALDALPDRSPALRKAVYDRARQALIGQLRSLEPPLSEADIDVERRALDAAIERLEVDHGGLPTPANDAATPPGEAAEAKPAPPPDPVPPPEAPELPEPAPPETPAAPPIVALPPAPSPAFAAAAEPPAAEPREAVIPIAARRPKAVPDEAAPPEPASPAAEAPPEAAAAPDGAGGGPQRPRIAVVPPRAGRSRTLRNAIVGTALAAVIALIAVAAFMLRDKPQSLPTGGPETAESQQPDGSEAKFGDRVNGESAPRAGNPAPRVEPQSAQSGITVTQRALLIEEAPGGENAQPVTTPGRATWRLDSVSGEQGQPLQSAVVATVAYPDAGLTLVMTIQRNLDNTLPASHTVSLAFSQTGTDAASRTVQDVGLLQGKDEEAGRGSPVSGLPVRVRENLFLIGLSSLRGDVERNTELLLRRNWFDIAVRYTSGRRAVLTFEKGAAGAQVVQSAFDAWQ